MTLQTIYMCYIITTYQMMSLGIHTLTQLICVVGVTSVEEGITNTVILSKRSTHITQSGHLQLLLIAIIGKVALCITSRL